MLYKTKIVNNIQEEHFVTNDENFKSEYATLFCQEIISLKERNARLLLDSRFIPVPVGMDLKKQLLPSAFFDPVHVNTLCLLFHPFLERLRLPLKAVHPGIIGPKTSVGSGPFPASLHFGKGLSQGHRRLLSGRICKVRRNSLFPLGSVHVRGQSLLCP